MKIIIHDGLDLIRATRVVRQYIEERVSDRHGWPSLAIYGTPERDEPDIAVYRTKAGAIVVRPASGHA